MTNTAEIVNTAALGNGEFVTVIPEPEDKGPKCPQCGSEFADWDCMGCGYEWST